MEIGYRFNMMNYKCIIVKIKEDCFYYKYENMNTGLGRFMKNSSNYLHALNNPL